MLPGAWCGVVPRVNSEMHAVAAGPMERRRERGRRAVPGGGMSGMNGSGAVAELLHASEYPEPAPQKWDTAAVRVRLQPAC